MQSGKCNAEWIKNNLMCNDIRMVEVKKIGIHWLAVATDNIGLRYPIKNNQGRCEFLTKEDAMEAAEVAAGMS